MKGVDYLFGFQGQSKATQIKKARYAIGNISKKDLLKIIREFEKLRHESYDNKRPKHDPTGSYIYPSRQLAKCMMRGDALNLHVYPVRTEMTAPSSNICFTEENE